jgi:hypothetical protein
MKTHCELYEAAYAAFHEAADILGNSAAPCSKNRWAVNPDGIRRALEKAREALSRLQALDNVLRGEPEPKRGD